MKHITELTWLAGILLSVAALCMWIPDFVQSVPLLWQTITTMVLSVCNAVLLMYLLYQSGVTRTRSAVPLFCYVLLVGAMGDLHQQWDGQLSVLALQAVLLLLMHAYRSANAVHESFLCTIVLCTAALLQPDILIMLPVVWIGLAVQRAMNVRVMLASLIAAGVFGLYMWISSMLYPDAFSVVSINDAFRHELPMAENLLQPAVLTVFAIVFAVISLTGFARENSRAQSLVLIMLMLTIAGVVMMFFPPAYFTSLMSTAAYCSAALAVYCFCSRQSVAMGIIFIMYILISLSVFVITLIKPF
ncbi:MAG: hypothetical protein IJ776_06225 [Paludibacteraceae bacterium]|nr:hypothetical protein [Paludibacteraceae bacterium]